MEKRRRTITVPGNILEVVDKHLIENDRTFSQFVTQCIRRYLSQNAERMHIDTAKLKE